ncbi:MAG TPA: hypothetical protein VLS90_06810 [Thermodesulfobacteriota bacterium]|nr:hypothetical protein [Thermodesulfobacteriota bacterium]
MADRENQAVFRVEGIHPRRDLVVNGTHADADAAEVIAGDILPENFFGDLSARQIDARNIS